MRKHPSRLVLVTIALAVSALFTGCAEIAQGLSATAAELQRQQDEAYYNSYYAPRPASDTSARGIK